MGRDSFLHYREKKADKCVHRKLLELQSSVSIFKLSLTALDLFLHSNPTSATLPMILKMV